jgi:hypothetical protein
MTTPARDLDTDAWVERVRRGDFAAIPRDLDFASAGGLALLIDGYGVAGGVGQCAAIHDRVLQRCLEDDRSGATALDLWISIFVAKRRAYRQGPPPEGGELNALDKLLAELRDALLALAPRQKAGIMAAMPAPLTPQLRGTRHA